MLLRAVLLRAALLRAVLLRAALLRAALLRAALSVACCAVACYAVCTQSPLPNPLQKHVAHLMLRREAQAYVRLRPCIAACNLAHGLLPRPADRLAANSGELSMGPYPTVVTGPSGKQVPVVQAAFWSK